MNDAAATASSVFGVENRRRFSTPSVYGLRRRPIVFFRVYWRISWQIWFCFLLLSQIDNRRRLTLRKKRILQ